jgi:hypothetical protein
MYKNIQDFVPFQHENAETKNNLIQFARNQDRQKPADALASTLIYANLVDYLARHLLENLHKMVSIFTFKQFGGVFHLDCSTKKRGLPLGELRKELSVFEFPQKADFFASLEEFGGLRNKVMHNLMRLDPNDNTTDLDKDIVRISEIAEDVLAKYNVISAGLVAIWNAANTSAPTNK